MEAKQIASQMADENGRIAPDTQEPTVDIDINIRQDDISLFETESGRQFLQTGDMADSVYVEPIPTENGFEAEVVVEPESNITEVSPAEPAVEETNEIGHSEIQVRMD